MRCELISRGEKRSALIFASSLQKISICDRCEEFTGK